jgi:hypothetical protein
MYMDIILGSIVDRSGNTCVITLRERERDPSLGSLIIMDFNLET